MLFPLFLNKKRKITDRPAVNDAPRYERFAWWPTFVGMGYGLKPPHDLGRVWVWLEDYYESVVCSRYECNLQLKLGYGFNDVCVTFEPVSLRRGDRRITLAEGNKTWWDIEDLFDEWKRKHCTCCPVHGNHCSRGGWF